MATNWYTRLLKNIIGRTSKDVSSKSELRIKRLEDRRLLNADFAFIAADVPGMMGAELNLTDFDGSTDLVTISETMHDFGSGMEVAYLFELDNQNWMGTDVAGMVDSTGGELYVAQSAFDTAFGGNISIDDSAMGSGSDVNVTFGDGTNDIDFVSDDMDGMTTTDVINLSITNAGDISHATNGDVLIDGAVSFNSVGTVNLNNALNDFQSTVTIADAGTVTIQDANALTIGGITTDIADNAMPAAADINNVTVTSGGDLTIAGVINTTGAAAGDAGDDNISLTSGGTLTIDEDVNAGQGDVILVAENSITQNTDDLITANELSAQVLDATPDGDQNINLGLGNNVDTFVADNDSAGGFVTFRSTRTLTIGSFNGITGISTTDDMSAPFSNDVSLRADLALSITQAIDAGEADVALTANGDIVQSGMGTISANDLSVTQMEAVAPMVGDADNPVADLFHNIDLTLANSVDTFTASNALDGSSINFMNNQTLSVGAVTSTNGNISITTDDGDADPDMHLANINVNGLVSSGAGAGDISLDADGDITLNLDGAAGGADADVINSGTGAVSLTADGDVSQDTDGAITAASLNVVQQDENGNITLDDANTVGTFSASNADNGGTITFNNDTTLSVGNVTSTNGDISITTNDGDADPNMHLANINVNGLVSSGAGAGDISLTADGDISLNLDAAAGGADADVINSGTGAVTLTANGNVTQDIDGTITGASLNVVQQDTDGSITLDDANTVSTFTASNADNGGTITFNNDITVSVGNVTSTSGEISITTNDGDADPDMHLANINVNGLVSSGGGDVSLNADGDITLDLAGGPGTDADVIDASSGGAVTLTADGDVTQAVDGAITANILTVMQQDVSGNVTLDAANTLTLFNSTNAATGGTITFNNDRSLTITGITTDAGAITVATDDAAATHNANILVTGLVTTGAGAGDVSLDADGQITLNLFGGPGTDADAINAGTGAVALTADGDITQEADGAITASSVNAVQQDDDGDIILDDSNTVETFTASNADNGGTITFNNDIGLTVGDVSSNNGAITITTDDGAATHNANITVSGLVSSIGADGAGVGTDGEILISADGTLALDGPGGVAGDATDVVVNSGSATTRLVGNGTISQTADGLIIANSLGVRQDDGAADANIDLCEMNVVSTFAANNASSNGFISFRSTSNLALGTVTMSGLFTPDTTGVTTQGGDIELQSDMTLTVDGTLITAGGGDVALIGSPVDLTGDLDVGAGDLFIDSNGALIVDHALTSMDTIRLRADGDITQTAIITAASLAVQQIATAIPAMDMGATDTDTNSRYDIVLDLDNVVSNFAASNAFDGGVAQFKTTENLTIRTITGVTGMKATMTDTVGVSTTFTGAANVADAGMTPDTDAGDILIETEGTMTIALDGAIDDTGSGFAIQAGATGNADVRLIADGNVQQDLDGLIRANEVGVELRDAAGDNTPSEEIDLRFNNEVDEFGATNGSQLGQVVFHSTENLNVGRVGAQSSVGGNITFANQNGVTANNGNSLVKIDSEQALSLDLDSTFDGMATGTAIDAGADGIVLLTSGGDLRQDADGLITARTLGARQRSTDVPDNSMTPDVRDLDQNGQFDILLCENNTVSSFLADNDSLGGEVSFFTNQSLVISNVITIFDGANSSAFFGIVFGVSTVDGDITIQTDNAAAMMDNTLSFGIGPISSVGAMDGADAMGSNDGDILLIADGGVTVGDSIDAGFIAGMETGDVQINSGSFINIQNDIDGNNVRLQANGDIFQGEDDIITANALAARQVGTTYAAANELNAADMSYNIQLGEDNVVSTFASTNAFEDGFILFRSTQNLTIGSLAAVAAAGKNPGFAVTTGVSTTDANAMVQGAANIFIDAGGSLFLDEAVNSTSTADVRLSANGDITQDAEGIITARNLGVRQNNALAPGMMDPAELGTPDMLFSVDLCEANVVGGFAASNASAGGAVLFRSTQNLSLVNVGFVTSQNYNFATTNGVTTNNGPIELQSDMMLTVNGTLITANGGDVALIGSSVDLTGALDVGAGDLFIDSNGALIVDHALTSMDTIRLRADGDITQTAIITAASLAVQQIATAIPAMDMGATDTDTNSRYDIVLDLDNVVSNFAASNAFDGGVAQFKTTENLTIRTITGVTAMKAPAMTDTVGVSTTFTGAANVADAGMTPDTDAGDILIESEGAMTLALDGFINTSGSGFAIQAGATGNADVRLIADGNVQQDLDGLIRANEVGVELRDAAGDNTPSEEIDLRFNNEVDEFGATNGSQFGQVIFHSTENLNVGRVGAQSSVGGNITFANQNGVTANNGNSLVMIDSEQALSLDLDSTFDGMATGTAINAGANGIVLLTSGGDLRQDTDGLVTSNFLGARQRSTDVPDNSMMMDSRDLDQNGQFDILLCENNTISRFFAENESLGGEVSFFTNQSLTITNLAVGFNGANSGAFFGSVIGVSTVDGDITIQTDNAAAMMDNTLSFGVGPISSVGAMDGADAMGSNDGDILLIADGAVTVGDSIDAGFIAGMETGDVQINSGSFINIQDDIDGNNVRLQANGEIIQGNGDIITANALAARQVGTVYDAADDVDPDSANSTFDIVLGFDNVVSEFAAFNAFDGGQITFHTTENLTIGSLDAVTAAGKNPGFAATTGVITTLGFLGNLDQDDDGDGTFNFSDGSLGDILIDTEQSLSINEAIRAGNLNFGIGNGANADVRLVASGDIRQGVNGTITADELGVRQIANMFSMGADVSGNGNFDIDLLSENDVLLVTLSNVIAEGDINFRDSSSVNINAMTESMIQNADFDQTIGIVANGGDIFVETETNLFVTGVTANSREIISTDGVVDSSNMAPAPEGESITLQTVNGDIFIGENVIITTDEDTAAGASSLTTNDSITIRAGETNNRLVSIQDGVQIRTDGGVALQFAPRPTTPLVNSLNTAFFASIEVVDGAISQTADSGEQFGNPALPSRFYSYNAIIGVVGEEGLVVSNNFRDPVNDTYAQMGITAGEEMIIRSRVTNDQTISSNTGIETTSGIAGGTFAEFGHLYSNNDLNILVNQGDARLIVDFSVSQHPSIQVLGSQISQNGFENVQDGIISRSNAGRARFELVPPVFVPVIEPDPEPEPNPAPINPEPVIPDVPVQLAFVEPPVASRVGVSSQSFDYFQLRRNEGDAGYVIIDEQISEDNGESLLDPSELRKYVDDNNIPDEQDYELWLITTKVNNSGQSVTLERPILKFDISGGRPIPAIEDLPMEFPELRLEPIPVDGDAEPVDNSEMNDADPENETPENPAKAEDEQENVSLLEDEKHIQRLDGSHQVSAIGVGSVLAVSSMNRKKSEDAGRRVRNVSLLSRIFGGHSSK